MIHDHITIQSHFIHLSKCFIVSLIFKGKKKQAIPHITNRP